MADAGDSKSPDRKVIPVQVRGSVLGVKPYTAQVCAPFIRGFECYKRFWNFGYLHEILYFCPSRGSNIGDRKMGGKHNEKPRLHKASGRAFIDWVPNEFILKPPSEQRQPNWNTSDCMGGGLRMTRSPRQVKTQRQRA